MMRKSTARTAVRVATAVLFTISVLGIYTSIDEGRPHIAMVMVGMVMFYASFFMALGKYSTQGAVAMMLSTLFIGYTITLV
jgi:hypothetical protein